MGLCKLAFPIKKNLCRNARNNHHNESYKPIPKNLGQKWSKKKKKKLAKDLNNSKHDKPYIIVKLKSSENEQIKEN